jgi:pantoate kinase
MNTGADIQAPKRSTGGALGLLLALALVAIGLLYIWGMQIAHSPEIEEQTGTSTAR